MKKRLPILLFASLLAAQATATGNFSVHRRYLSADRSRYVDEVVWYDGLRRPVGNEQRAITPQDFP